MTESTSTQDTRPNIILILADDMGFSDLGCFGAEIRTPNLDRMAESGLRFTQVYNCARCCPTRASLLTGLYPHQAGVGHMVEDHGVGPAYQGYLRGDTATLGEALGAAGYTTLYAGKWHVSPGIPVIGEPASPPGSPANPTPTSRGFDRFYGTLAGCANYFYPHALVDQDTPIRPNPENYYYTDAISAQACYMIAEAAGHDRPFFLHACYTAPHWPLHALPEDIETYRGLYRQGWDHFRTARHEELKGLGVLDARWPISPRDDQSRDFTADSPQRQAWEDLRMAVYAAQVTRLDHGIGQMLNELERLGIAENTLVIFMSDNGGCAEFLDEDGDGRSWPGLYRHTAPPGQTCRVGNTPGLEPGPASTFMSYDLPWANLSNTPFRLYKHWVHEGGIATPMVASWPGGIRNRGCINHSVIHTVDFMATFLDLAGGAYPRENDSGPVQSLEGESFAPVLRGESWQRQRPVVWEHEGNRAVRDGRWKLVSRHPGAWELYDMFSDRTELNDLSELNRPQVDRMAKVYHEWAERCDVLPWERLRG